MKSHLIYSWTVKTTQNPQEEVWLIYQKGLLCWFFISNQKLRPVNVAPRPWGRANHHCMFLSRDGILLQWSWSPCWPAMTIGKHHDNLLLEPGLPSIWQKSSSTAEMLSSISCRRCYCCWSYQPTCCLSPAAIYLTTVLFSTIQIGSSEFICQSSIRGLSINLKYFMYPGVSSVQHIKRVCGYCWVEEEQNALAFLKSRKSCLSDNEERFRLLSVSHQDQWNMSQRFH